MANKHVQVIVVGAGAGGGTAAKELSVNGYSVVVFERGDWPQYDRHINDELISQRGSVLAPAYGPDPDKHPRVQFTENNEVVPIDNSSSHIASCVGSGTVTYGAMAWRFMQEDFKMKSVYGAIEDSTLEDWPISYEELEPCYEKAEWEIGVSGDDSNNPYAPPRGRDFPMPGFENNEDGKVLSDACKRLGLHPFPIPMARNSIRYNGRPACIRNRTCVGYACPVDAKNGTHNSVIPVALKSGNCELRTNCQVTRIIMKDRDTVHGVEYYDENKKLRIQTADKVIVAAAAIESARLLLTSGNGAFPRGLGNNNDLVGRNLQAHAYCGASGLFDHDIQSMKGPGATFGICDYNHHNKGVIGGGLLANEFYLTPYLFSNFRPPGSKSWGEEHKEFQRDNFYRYSRMMGPIQEIPNYHSRVLLYRGKKDYWGMPVIGFSGSRHPMDQTNTGFLSKKAEEIIKESGAIQTWRFGSGKGQGRGAHQIGTCRMGNDPTTSVTNRFGRIHDIRNLYVADGGLCVTGGGFNPALTIMALGYWVAENIIKDNS
jgi:choline dehydrogenase-like flavoprotein